MTDINFHFNVPDRLDYACRLLRKAWRRGARVVVSAPASMLGQLDRQLWTFDPLEFIPHLHVKPGQTTAERLRHTAIWLTAQVEDAPHQEVLLNLGAEPVPGFESFSRLIELVSLDDADRQAGRSRWKHYSDRGYAISRHDVAKDAGV